MALKSLVEDPEHYRKAFETFVALSNEFNVYADWGKEGFTEAVASNIRAKLGDQEELRVLGVGGGSGERDCIMLDNLKLRFPRINNRVVEPLKEQLVHYKGLAQSKAHELQGVSFDWRQQTIEQYENTRDLTKFHFISVVHTMYYVNNADHTLMYLYNLLEAGGVLLVVILSDDSGFCRFGRQFKRRFESFQDRYHYYICSADIRSTLDRQSIPYTLHPQSGQVDITKCFDETSEEGSLLLDFFTNVVKFKETASEDLQRRAMEYLGSSDCSERKSDGEILLSVNVDSIVIRKLVP